MQVKKFEAKNIKDALQMVKQELGPEAIIISAKDNRKSFGLAGDQSVEVTAAITDRALNSKKFAESKLNKADKERFQTQPAEKQKKFIEKAVNRYGKSGAVSEAAKRAAAAAEAASKAATQARGPTNRRYIDIRDEEENPIIGKSAEDALESFSYRPKPYLFDDSPQGAVPKYNNTDSDVNSLKEEVKQLRELLNQMSKPGQMNSRGSGQHPGAEFGLPYDLSYQFEKLSQAGIDHRFIVEILDQANRDLTGLDKKKKSLIDAWVARYIMAHTDVTGSYRKDGDATKLHLFVGPSGHGKTTMLVKLASHYVMQEKLKVVVFSADTHKVGALEQLKIFCQILNVPLETIKHSIEFEKLLSKHYGADIILVDYPGLALKDISEIDQLRALMPHRELHKYTHLVLGATSKDLDAYEIAQRYNSAQFDGILVTKLDESYNHGLLYNIQRKTQKPLSIFGTGPKIPEDMELATKERVLDLIYKITKNNF